MKKRLSQKALASLCVLIVLLLTLAIWTIWGNTALMINTITVLDSQIPSEFTGFRIAQVSDLHNAEFGEENAHLLNLLSESQPDIITITGDLVDAQHTDINTALSFAEKADRIAPVYYVTGNHEASLPQYEELKTGLEVAGVTVLEDKAIQLERNGSFVTLIGLSDPNFTIKSNIFDEVPVMISTKLNDLMEDKAGYTILLSHRPELFDTYVSCGVDLVLSGHAHGGQFRLPLIGGLVAPNQGFFPKYDAGLYTNGGTNMVVSRGLGNSIIPLRFNNRPEIVLVELITDLQQAGYINQDREVR